LALGALSLVRRCSLIDFHRSPLEREILHYGEG
jgi:hypothetical protein